MYYGLKRAFPELTVVSEEREDTDTMAPMPNLYIPVKKNKYFGKHSGKKIK